MRPERRHAVRATLCAAAVLTAAAASARVVHFTRLPVAHLEAPPAPSLAPRSIPAAEHAKGVVVKKSPTSQYDPGPPRYSVIYPSAKEARRFGTHRIPGPAPGDACFAVMQGFSLGQKHPSWPASTSAHPSIVLRTAVPSAARSGGMHMGGVTAVHREELVASGAHATLLVTDAWVDPQTLGVRVLGSHKLALSKVAEGPGHIRVYSFRDGHTVEFVVTTPKPPQALVSPPADHGLVGGLKSMVFGPQAAKRSMIPAFVAGMTRSLTFALSSGDVGSSDCGHVRVALDVTPGHGDAASVAARVVLPPVEPADGAHAEVRLRPLAVQLSVSQLPSEPTPTASVSFGWTGPEVARRL